MTDIPGLVARLCQVDVRFILVGGVAGVVHGSARLTQAVDIVYDRAAENLERLVAALAELSPYLRGAPPGLPFDWSVRTLERGLNFTLTTSSGDIDLLGEITGGGDYTAVLPHTIEVPIFGRRVRCIDLDWLIRTKRAAGRPRDFEAIAELEALRDERGGSTH